MNPRPPAREQTNELAVAVRGLRKDFILPHEQGSKSIKTAFIGMFRSRKRGAEIQHVLKGIDFEIRKGEFFGIVGRNGSGKSTLLKMLAGIYQPTAGVLTTHGSIVPMIELGVGFIGELTGRQNVYLNGAMFGFSKAQVDAMYDDIVAFAGLPDFMDQQLKNYSSGMQVRLAFSVATRAKADILIVDEVLAVGDADFQRKCYEYFSELKGSETTIIFVTHDMSAVQQYCDRAIMIEKGEIVAAGSADEVATAYQKLFLRERPEVVTAPVEERANQWGEGGARTVMASLEKESLLADDDLVLRVTIEADEEIPAPVIGFLVKSNDGARVFGENSKFTTTSAAPLPAGQRATYEWRCPNIYADGRFRIDLAIESPGGARYEYWEAALEFTVARQRHARFHVFAPVTLTRIG